MASTGLNGPFVLDHANIDNVVTATHPGAYALGYVGSDGAFYVEYVGRADSDLNDRLHDHVGTQTHFKGDYFTTAKAAFEKECHLYHDFSPRKNLIHPAAPNGATCPRCRPTR